jgi:hypothetical protein
VACTQGRVRAVLAPPLVALKMLRDTPTWPEADQWRAFVSAGIDQTSTTAPTSERGAPKPWALSWPAPEEPAGDGELVALAHTGVAREAYLYARGVPVRLDARCTAHRGLTRCPSRPRSSSTALPAVRVPPQ